MCDPIILGTIMFVLFPLQYVSTLQPPGGCDDISAMSQEDLIEWKQVTMVVSCYIRVQVKMIVADTGVSVVLHWGEIGEPSEKGRVRFGDRLSSYSGSRVRTPE